MTALQKTQQAAEGVRGRYLHPTKGQKLLTSLVELGKGWNVPPRSYNKHSIELKT